MIQPNENGFLTIMALVQGARMEISVHGMSPSKLQSSGMVSTPTDLA
jgi:hypothetical protein